MKLKCEQIKAYWPSNVPQGIRQYQAFLLLMVANFDEFLDFGQISLNGGQIWPQNIGRCLRKLAVVYFIALK